MSIPVRTITTIAGLSLTGAGGYYYAVNKKLPNEAVTISTQPSTPKHYDHRPFTLLSSQDIDQRLYSGQFVTKPQTNKIKAIYTNQLPSNDPVEDNYSINTFQQGLIAGVYDGHIGPHCSRLIKKQLPIYMARELGSNKKDVESAISTAFEDLDQDIQQRFYDIFPKNLKRTTEKDIQAAVARQPDRAAAEAIINEAINGSCACTVYLKDGYIYSANTGDSRVVIVSQDQDGTWKGRRLVEEQSPADPKWKAHLLSQHPPKESDVIVMRNRIFGLIAVGGSFGDIMYKVPVEYQMKVLPFIPYDSYKTFARYHHRIVVHYRTPPYLQSKPLVSKHKIKKDDRFVILATDGLWDELSWDDCRSTEGDQEAARIMSTWKKDVNPATHLVRQALLLDAVYKNVHVKEPVEDETLELSKRLTRKPSRNYRDDITVTVIELDTTDASPVYDNVGPVYEAQEVETNVPRLANPKNNSWFSGWIWSRL
ncbi:phosphatase 2C-like domain-containing protein [Gilbertella persicaria]|uniref:Pyruvate dehyrogenase phosphatase catalytic subunit n=1 Tax=Rhizopus stolonifer TaxID=4846 RepID=A0A367KPF8_RHIST|nr:phosphatase 2C-like domain-containing protein [Gilbertella persicaria]KAI8072174.1 phosphatase 2C-like domain-containing protein [Gilbertella persicaria]RCI04088.1 Pyruvate dehyrogenase phosphatase catalytic subunit [Rhizopus stolonifer]